MASPQELVNNPPSWVTQTVATMLDRLGDFGIRPDLFPKLADVRAKRDQITAHLQEYGCGVYGCVLPTYDKHYVLKVSGDDTEAEFAASLANLLEPRICVHYEAVIPADDMADAHGKQVYLLWRESADYVGRLGDYVDERGGAGDKAIELVDDQHIAGQEAYQTLNDYVIGKRGTTEMSVYRAVGRWLNKCEAMARQTQVPELRWLGDGLVQVFTARRVLFGDIHAGNLGLVHRPEGDRWVITDPGHVAVVNVDV